MLGVLLLIGKIIGIILLCIICLLLFLLFAVLFVPVRYGADVSVADKKASGKVTVSWLLRLLLVSFSFGDRGNGLLIRLAGVRLRKRKGTDPGGQERKKRGTERKKKARKPEALQKAEKSRKPPEIQEAEKFRKLQEDENARKPEEEREAGKDGYGKFENPYQEEDCKLIGQAIQDSLDEAKEKGKISSHHPSDRQPHDSRFRSDDIEPGRLQKLYQSICRKAERIIKTVRGLGDKKQRLSSVLEYLGIDGMQGSIGRLKKNLLKLLIHVLPRKGRAELCIGFDNPAATGQVLGLLAMLYPRFQGNLTVTPYFDRSILEGEISCRGRIRMITLLIIVIKTVLDKNIRSFVKKVRNGGM